MTKADLVETVTASIARTAGPMISKKDCARVVDAFLDAIKDALRDQHNIEIERNLQSWNRKPVLRRAYREFHERIAALHGYGLDLVEWMIRVGAGEGLPDSVPEPNGPSSSGGPGSLPSWACVRDLKTASLVV